MLIELRPFVDPDEALRERIKRELELRSPDIEVVVLGAASEEALRNTHARYFGDPTRGLLAGVV
jgi:hypothetical protein